jgi:peptidoglycan/LPS O-acetylase OafA/YrhL
MGASKRPELRYNASLDGIRAFAVLAVIASHEATWLPGGFYGVDTFFVLSGFLITSLLVTEWSGSGGIALLRFWGRRARRLLPALFVLVAVVGVVAAVWPATLGAPHLVSDGVTTLFYSANWYLVSQHVGYFEAIAHPSPLLHTWSLAIEEQFYLVWPLVVLAVLRTWRRRAAMPVRQARRSRRRRLVVLLVVSAVGSVASAVVMATISPRGGGISEHAYYGTDTRVQGLLVGAALSVAFTLWGPAVRPSSRRAFGALALAGVAASAALWAWVPETSGLAFHGGFYLAALATAAVIAGAVQATSGVVARVLALPPLRALGRISYGVYLWYWPVLLVMTGSRVGVSGNLLMLLRIAVTVVLATVSYVAIERPVRNGAFPGWRAAVGAPVGMAVGVLAMLAASLVPAAAAAPAVKVPLPREAKVAANVSAGAGHGARPVKVLLVGDSVAGSLGVGLSVAAPSYGVQLVNEGTPGCSVSMQASIKVLWYTVPPSAPCAGGDLLRTWRTWVAAYNPDVVVYLARGELFDQQARSGYSNVLSPAFDHYLQGRFGSAVDVLGSRGAAVVLMTTPSYDSGEQGSGAPWPEDDPARVAADNAVIVRAARLAAHGARGPAATVFALGGLLSPGGQYRDVVDGVSTRCQDGVHFTAAAGEWLAPRLFREVVRLGAAHHAASPGGAWPGSPPAAVPAWWQKLSC